MWSSLYARCWVRCESLSGKWPDTSAVVLQRLFYVMLSWKALPHGTVPQDVVKVMCDSINDLLKVRDRLVRPTQRDGGRYRLVPLTPPPSS